ncbi:DUF6538 domain-containing protein [Gluconobacter cerinus]|uniref:DUF6538 domain-containing protein n=1 Tax=Gluconobacter cerinus TaxID=38307 RepID=UPI0031FE7AD2
MLIRLQSGFHFRRGIPLRFRPILGKREIWHSLETPDRNGGFEKPTGFGSAFMIPFFLR